MEKDIEIEYVRDLVRACQLFPATPPVEVEHWPWPLKIYTLGRFEIVKDDQPLRLPARAQQKPILLLKALIGLGGRRVHEEHLAELLWPDADGDLQHQNFRTTLHRLRRLLALADALVYDDGQLSLNPRLCWVDLWGFQRLATQSTNAWKNDEKKAAELSKKAIRLYQGRLMHYEESRPWLHPLRERLHSRFLGQLEALGRHYQQNRNWRQAVDLYWQGITIDPLAETLYQRIIDCQLEAGNGAEAARTYTCCQENLRHHLGTAPSLRIPAFCSVSN